MKRRNFVSGWRVALSLSFFLCGFGASAYCQSGDIALLIQQSPSDGGSVTPAVGIHYFAPGEEVELVALAEPGYQFLQWLGDVSDPG